MHVPLPRRAFVRLLGVGALGGATGALGTLGCNKVPAHERSKGAWPEKADDLIVLTERPPNLEMPAKYLVHDITPNEAMFVRWHVSGVPTSVDTRTFRLNVTGHVATPLALSLAELKQSFAPVSVVAVNQCSGNGRSTFDPRVPGVQWGGGAIGNAKWTGVRLKDILAKAGAKDGAASVAFGGLDRAPLPTVPEFMKSLAIDRAVDPDVIVAWGMNDAPLPMLNGFPLRLIVPGWYSTYWVKALETVDVKPSQFEGFWMKKAYRLPANEAAVETPGELAKDTRPISRMNVRSLFARPLGGEPLPHGRVCEVEGVAFDGGTGIARVELSTDGGTSFRDADLGPDLGRFSFRRWRAKWTPESRGKVTLVVRATSRGGEMQRVEPRWNRGGYMKNDPEKMSVTVS